MPRKRRLAVKASPVAMGQQQTWPPTRANRTQVDQCAAPVVSCRTSAMILATSSAIFGPWRRATRRSAGSPLARRSPTSASRALSSRFQASILRAQADLLRRAAGDILPGRQAVGRDYLRCRGFQRADVGLPSLPDHALNETEVGGGAGSATADARNTGTLPKAQKAT